MRVVNRVKGNTVYLVDSFDVIGTIGYQTIHKSTGSMKDAKAIARRELAKGASHVNISAILCHCFPK